MTDTVAPVLNGISLNKTSITINGVPVTVTVTLDLFDAGGSGLSEGINTQAPGIQVRFRSPSNQFVDALFFPPANTNSGSFSGDMTLGKYAEAGEWTVESCLLSDMAGNYTYLFPSDAGSLLTGLKFTVSNANSDAIPPQVHSISTNDHFLDLDAGETKIVVTARLTDDLAGLFRGAGGNGSESWPQIIFKGPSGQLAYGLFDDSTPGNTPLDDTYKATVTLESGAEPGEWIVEGLVMSDQAGNTVWLRAEDEPKLAAIAFEVKNSFGDSGPPVVDWITFANPTLNPNGSAQFIVEAHLVDDKSGLSDGTAAGGIGVSSPQVRFVSASGQAVDGIFDIAHPVSGSTVDGVFRATVTLSAFAETGVWHVEYVLLSDEAGNYKAYFPADTPQIPADAIFLGTELPDTIPGTPESEAIYGFGGDDKLSGEAGGDTLGGGSGNDVVSGGAGDDTVVGGHGAGNDVYKGGAGFDRVTYTSAESKITVDLQKGRASGPDIDKDKLKQIEGVLGGQSGDRIKGSKFANILDGYTGKDKLTGGNGKDVFVFSTELGQNNVDTITDFNHKDDVIGLNEFVFSGLEIGKLAKSKFVVGEKAGDEESQIVYDKSKGILLFDANGNNKGGEVVFAKIANKSVEIGAGDFIVL